MDCCCSGPRILGVFDSMEAAIERLRMFSAHVDEGEEYRIECFELKDYETEHEQTEKVLRRRAEWQADKQSEEE